MEAASKTPRKKRLATRLIRQRIEDGGERLWRFDQFANLPFTAVAKALSRLAQQGALERISKGVYYRTRQTPFGTSRPHPTAIEKMGPHKNPVFPSGLAAANLLGFTTQTGKRREVATSALSLPRKLIGAETLVHTRRPEAWASLSEKDAALLDFLRQGGRFSELAPQETIQKTLALLSEPGTWTRLLKVAEKEPPRVRALLGALGEQLGKTPKLLRSLRMTLNPSSQFDFGVLTALTNARAWRAKAKR